ncbi:MbtH family protein [Streptomyces coacervatus]|uniref:MbtH family protein n=1 Tax=Streptomyces coacervatus TaxID=647381 RepID=A0ABP7H690_9ACTN|nr:MbtH family protein [Streptomyces coacervatus]MDF2271594.1 MbtH family protein [Streptomyces coacervatus]
MSTNPFEDESAGYVVLMNDEDQHSIWPDKLDLPTGWRRAFGVGSRAECLAYIKANWTDIRPASIRTTS